MGKLRLLSYVKGINRKHLVNSLLIASISSNGLFVVWVSYLAIVRNLPQSSYAFLKPSTLFIKKSISSISCCFLISGMHPSSLVVINGFLMFDSQSIVSF